MISDELRSGTESPQPFGTQGSDSVLEQWEDARDGPPFEFGHHEKLVDAADKLAEAYRTVEAENERLRAALEKLAATPHVVVEDSWYSCPESGDCIDDRQDGCNCITGKVVGIAEAALAEIEKEVGR